MRKEIAPKHEVWKEEGEMNKFKKNDVVEDNGGCSHYLAGTVDKVVGTQIYLKGRDSWIHQNNLKHLDLIGRDIVTSIKEQTYLVRVLKKLKNEK